MKLTNEFQPIRDWAEERGLIEHGNRFTQTIKLIEEAGELSSGMLKSNPSEIKDAIGDCVVVLTNLASICEMTIEDCINSAYEEIKDRTGVMSHGTFVKDD